MQYGKLITAEDAYCAGEVGKVISQDANNAWVRFNWANSNSHGRCIPNASLVEATELEVRKAIVEQLAWDAALKIGYPVVTIQNVALSEEDPEVRVSYRGINIGYFKRSGWAGEPLPWSARLETC